MIYSREANFNYVLYIGRKVTVIVKKLGVIILVLFVSGTAQAGVSRTQPQTQTTRKVLSYCDEVCEIQAQDQAFALLLESYRQYRSFRIQALYEERVSAASAVGTENGSMIIASDSEGLRALRGWVLHLAEKEREISLQQLQADVGNMSSGYKCVRRLDEERVGQKVASAMDMKRAATQLKDYVVIAEGVPNNGDFHLIHAVPSSAIMLDAASVIPGTETPIEGCEE